MWKDTIKKYRITNLKVNDDFRQKVEDALEDFKPFALVEDIKEALKNRETRSEFKLRNILAIFNPCKWNVVTFDIVSCLLGGMSLQEAIPIIIKKSLPELYIPLPFAILSNTSFNVPFPYVKILLKSIFLTYKSNLASASFCETISI